MNKEQVAQSIARFRLRSSRGYAFIGDFVRVFNFSAILTMFIDTLNRHYGWNIPLEMTWLGCVVLAVGLYIFAYLDEKHLGFWKYENRYNSKELNPFLAEMSDNIKEIKDKLK